MPKETIYGHDGGRYVAQVAWSPDHTLQLGVEEQAGFSLVTALYGEDQSLEKIGMAALNHVRERFDLPPVEFVTYEDQVRHSISLGRDILDSVESSNVAVSASGYSGVWVTLDRPGTNRLIRVLRRARGAVFGEDE